MVHELNITLEEAEVLGVGPYEARAIQTLGKEGLSFTVICQEPFFPNDEYPVQSVVMQNMNHVWMRAGSEEVAQLAALDLMGLVSPNAIKTTHVSPKQIQVGWHQADSSSGFGLFQKKNDRAPERPAPVYEHLLETRHTYYSTQEQVDLLKKWILNLPKGEAFVRCGPDISHIRFPPLTTTISDSLALSVIARRKRQPPFISTGQNLGSTPMAESSGNSGPTPISGFTIPIRTHWKSS